LIFRTIIKRYTQQHNRFAFETRQSNQTVAKMFKSLTTLAVFTGTTFAQSIPFVTIGLGADLDDPTAALARNVTMHFPFTGYNISKPFPASPMDGWSLDLDVAADVPAHLPDGTKGFVTLSDVYVTPPKGELDSEDSSWDVCAQYIGPIDATGDDGSCSTALGKECIDDWISATMAAYNKTGCAAPSMPLSCLDRVKSYYGSADCKLRNRPFSRYQFLTLTFPHPAWPNPKTNSTQLARVFDDGGFLHQEGNHTVYDTLGNVGHVVVVSFNSRLTNQTLEYVTIGCLRADNTTAGSRVPGAGSVHTTSTALMVGLAMVVGLLVAT
jgi:hypothetical protein